MGALGWVGRGFGRVGRGMWPCWARWAGLGVGFGCAGRAGLAGLGFGCAGRAGLGALGWVGRGVWLCSCWAGLGVGFGFCVSA